VAASATDRLHGRKRACIHARAGAAEGDIRDDHAQGRWPKRPPLHKQCRNLETWRTGASPVALDQYVSKR